MKFKYIYGPVSSWRLGNSLGIDLLSQERKVCSFNCLYCQLGEETDYSLERKVYVPTVKIIEELKRLPLGQIDYLTFSGQGESTLAKNLGEVIKTIRTLRKEPIAILTNATLIAQEEVKNELSLTNFVIAKLDASSQKELNLINKPIPGVKFDEIYQGIKSFKKEYKGKLALQMMFIKESNEHLERLAELALEIAPDEIQVNTPLRPCQTLPLSKEEIFKIKKFFKKLNSKKLRVISVYDREHKKIKPLNVEDTLKRRGKD
ncbi:radical SAM protein [bacterium]|nr:radical SAM protein [bacterium]MBU1153553.1 radical SAM protein [bacterium]MBU1781938.1 radical SAM protein [bacterium]